MYGTCRWTICVGRWQGLMEGHLPASGESVDATARVEGIEAGCWRCSFNRNAGSKQRDAETDRSQTAEKQKNYCAGAVFMRYATCPASIRGSPRSQWRRRGASVSECIRIKAVRLLAWLGLRGRLELVVCAKWKANSGG